MLIRHDWVPMSEFRDLNQAKEDMIERLKELERLKVELVNQVETTVQLDEQLAQERRAKIAVAYPPWAPASLMRGTGTGREGGCRG